MRTPSKPLDPAPHFGRISRRGAVVLDDFPAWRETLARFAGQDVVIEVRLLADEYGTQSQHGYYRTTILPGAAKAFGFSDWDECHEWLARKHIARDLWVLRNVDGEAVALPPSLALLSKPEMSAFMQRVIDHATEHGGEIPQPRGKCA